MSDSFTALDFETANHHRTSICQVGLVRYERGRIAFTLSRLVRPPGNWYLSHFTDIHGIAAHHTAKAPGFAELWPEIKDHLSGTTVVAHNGHSFDFDVLRKTLAHYELPTPAFEACCTYRLYGRKLDVLCAEHGILLDHHDALSDAKACGQLYLNWLRRETKAR